MEMNKLFVMHLIARRAMSHLVNKTNCSTKPPTASETGSNIGFDHDYWRASYSRLSLR